jgi:hypothetical protein
MGINRDIAKELLKPDAYPENAKSVRLVQTHISYVFITDRFVYKVKKPVNFGFLDFSALSKRRYYCEQEVELNRRLSPSIYIGVVPVVERNGRLFIGGKGKIVDYAVKMKKLPLDRLMSKLLREGKLSRAMMLNVAKAVARFHAEAAASAKISRFGKLAVVKRNTDENFQQTEKYIGVTITQEQFDAIREYTRRFYARKRELFEERIAQGRIRDCHGDIHTEHVCLSAPPVIFDCIEFNERFRYSDTAADVAFLAMDLDYNGRSDLSAAFIDAYVMHSGDGGVLAVLDFYKVYRAYVRGKVISFLLDDRSIPEEERRKAAGRAQKYFSLAYEYARNANAPSLVIVCGLMGTGKSTVARALSENTGFEVLSSDSVRKKLARITEKEHRYVGYGSDVYSRHFTKLTYSEMLETAGKMLSRGESVILDACFPSRTQRLAAQKAARKNGAQFFCVELVCPESTVRKRLDKRFKRGTDSSDGRWELYHRQKSDFEKIEEFPRHEKTTGDTRKGVRRIASAVVKRLGETS